MVTHGQVATVQRLAERYPASPMQQGMLFESLAALHSGVDIEQILCTLSEELNVPAFRQAWEQVVERHTILRTGFRLAGQEPQQEVHSQVRLHLEQKDWRGLTQREQEDRLNAYLHAERRRGFELSVPPLMRLTLFHAGEAKHILAWTFHPLLLDSRARVVLLHEVFRFYEAVCEGRDLKSPAPRPYRNSIDWLRMFVEWNETETDFPRDECVHGLFETQVERTPNAVALVYTKEEVSYRELDNQANRVAHHLRSLLDVGPTENTVVATSAPGAPVRDGTSRAPPIGHPIDNINILHLSIRSLFEKPTVAAFSKEFERRTTRPAPQCGPGLTRVSREPYRLTSLSSKADTTTANYN